MGSLTTALDALVASSAKQGAVPALRRRQLETVLLNFDLCKRRGLKSAHKANRQTIDTLALCRCESGHTLAAVHPQIPDQNPGRT